MKKAKQSLKKGANPNLQTAEKEPLLNYSISQYEIELAYLLLDFAVDVNAVDDNGRSSLHVCADMGLLDLAEELLAAGANAQYPHSREICVTHQCSPC